MKKLKYILIVIMLMGLLASCSNDKAENKQVSNYSVTFSPEEVHDLVTVKLHIDDKDYTVDDTKSLKWFEENFSKAQELKGWPNCPYDAILTLTRKDGAVMQIEVATDSCNNIKSGDVWYMYPTETGSNTPLYDLFGIKVMFGNVLE